MIINRLSIDTYCITTYIYIYNSICVYIYIYDMRYNMVINIAIINR